MHAVATWLAWASHTAIAHGAVIGAISAAAIDLEAFRKWQSWHDAVTYSWSLASWRWFRGAVLGAITASGYAALIG